MRCVIRSNDIPASLQVFTQEKKIRLFYHELCGLISIHVIFYFSFNISLSPGWPVHWLARLSHLPFLWWRYWLWLHISANGAFVCWLWQEIQTGICDLPSTSSINSSSRTLQLHSDNSHHLGTLWLCLHGGQWSHLWHLPSQLGHREANLHQPEPTDWSNCVLHHSFTPLWWCAKCWLDWVSGNYHLGSKDGAVVRALSFHQCGQGWIPRVDATCGLSLLLVLSLLQEVFLRVLQFSPLLKNQYFQIPIRSGMVDEEPLCECATTCTKSLFIYLFYLFILFSLFFLTKFEEKKPSCLYNWYTDLLPAKQHTITKNF